MSSHYADNYSELGIIMEDNRLEYCKKYGYQFFIKRKDFYGELGFGFSKIRFLLDLCLNNDFDYIHWGGVDTLITNFNIKIEDWLDNKHSFFISKEESGEFRSLNADVFIVKNDKNGRGILEFILSKFDDYKRHPWQEQQVMINCLEKEFGSLIKIMPHQSFNSYPWRFYDSNQSGEADIHKNEPGDFKPGDFLLHCPGHTLENRLRIFKFYIPQIIK